MSGFDFSIMLHLVYNYGLLSEDGLLSKDKTRENQAFCPWGKGNYMWFSFLK